MTRMKGRQDTANIFKFKGATTQKARFKPYQKKGQGKQGQQHSSSYGGCDLSSLLSCLFISVHWSLEVISRSDQSEAGSGVFDAVHDDDILVPLLDFQDTDSVDLPDLYEMRARPPLACAWHHFCSIFVAISRS